MADPKLADRRGRKGNFSEDQIAFSEKFDQVYVAVAYYALRGDLMFFFLISGFNVHSFQSHYELNEIGSLEMDSKKSVSVSRESLHSWVRH